MRDFLQLLWRVVLAISVVAGPIVPVTADAHPGEATHAVVPAEQMPCHGDAAPPARPAPKAPCDDGCCPQPECDPGLCRIAGPMITAFAPFLAAPAPQSLLVPPAMIAPPDAFAPPLLRPPIA